MVPEQNAHQAMSTHKALQPGKESGSSVATSAVLDIPPPNERAVAQAENALEASAGGGTSSVVVAPPVGARDSLSKQLHDDDDAISGPCRSDYRSNRSNPTSSSRSSTSNSPDNSRSGKSGRSGSNSRDNSRSNSIKSRSSAAVNLIPAAFRSTIGGASSNSTALPTAFRQFRAATLPTPSPVPTAFRTKLHDGDNNIISSSSKTTPASTGGSPALHSVVDSSSTSPLTPLTAPRWSTLFSPPLSPEEARTMARSGRYSPQLSPKNGEGDVGHKKKTNNESASKNNKNTTTAATNVQQAAANNPASTADDSSNADSDAEFTPFDALRSHFAMGSPPTVVTSRGGSPVFGSSSSPQNHYQHYTHHHQHRGTQVNLAAAVVDATDSVGSDVAIMPEVTTDNAAAAATEHHCNDERSTLVPSPTNVAEFDDADDNGSKDKDGGDAKTTAPQPPKEVGKEEEKMVEDTEIAVNAFEAVKLAPVEFASPSSPSSSNPSSSEEAVEFRSRQSAQSPRAQLAPLPVTFASPSPPPPPPQVLLAADSGWENVGAPFSPSDAGGALSGLDSNFFPNDKQRCFSPTSPNGSPGANELRPRRAVSSAWDTREARPWLRFVVCVALAVAAGGAALAAFHHHGSGGDHSVQPPEGGNALKQRPLGRWARQPQPLDMASSEAVESGAFSSTRLEKETIDSLLEPDEQGQPRLVPPSAFGVVRATPMMPFRIKEREEATSRLRNP